MPTLGSPLLRSNRALEIYSLRAPINIAKDAAFLLKEEPDWTREQLRDALKDHWRLRPLRIHQLVEVDAATELMEYRTAWTAPSKQMHRLVSRAG